MGDINSQQQNLTATDAYQYNYAYIEPIAMVDTLPASENFSKPWLELTGKQVIKLAINTLIVNRGDQGQQGVEDDVRQFLGQVLLQTLQEEHTSFQPQLIMALTSLLPQLLLKLTSPAVKVAKTVETTVQQTVQPIQPIQPVPVEPLPAAPTQTTQATQTTEVKVVKTVEATLQPPAQPAEVHPGAEMANSIAAGLEQLLQPSPSAPAAVPIGIPAGMPISPVQMVEVAKGIATALQQPLQNMPSSEADVDQFITSNLIKLLGTDFLKLFVKNLFKGLNEQAPRGRANSLEDYRKLFAYIELPEIANQFQADEVFAYMRVAGPNPVMLQRLTAPDPRFPVTEAQYQAQMAGDSLQTAITEGRVYLADYGVLAGALNGTYSVNPPLQKYSYAPLALFAVPPSESSTEGSNRLLRPVAIQCGQSPADYPVITPATGDQAWQIAKTIVQIADANFHEAVSHFACTHLLVEPFVIATHRQLPPTHPLFQLLLPHFQGTLAINYAAHQYLVSPKGGVNQLLSSTIDNSRVLIVKGFQTYGFNSAMLPRRLQALGVDDSSVLPVYPYRDDGLLIWQAIHDWVEAYLCLYYSSNQDLQADLSLQSWAEELVAFEGGRLSDFGDTGDGKIKTLDYLADAVTMVIFTASAQHAAVNFPQNGIMSFAPAMPTAGYAAAATIGAELPNWSDLLPPLDQAQAQLNLLYLLGSVYFTKLGSYEDGHFTNPMVAPLLQTFQQRLQEIEQTIDQRNQTRPVYEYLKPSNIPQSINI